MTRRQAAPAEHRALTTLAAALAAGAYTWTPGIITPALAAVITYLTVITLTASMLHHDIPHTLTATTHTLRRAATTALRGATTTLQAVASCILWLLVNLTAAINTVTPDAAKITNPHRAN
jgi:hypothetical protein